ncbi:hypothetical protein NFI96_018404 [Prochilodus magdalenae]|nr:hypothetical protein NFI96_018404 [Prochilodus magdalenae]
MTSSKLQKLRVDRQQSWKGFGHQGFVCCLMGLYGCQWKHHQHTGSRFGHFCCSKLECGSFAMIIVTFCLSLVFLYFWTKAQNDYNDFDWFNFGSLGFWFPWSVVLLVIAAVFFTYIAFLLLLAVCLLSEGQKLYLHWSHKTGIFVTFIFSITATAVLSDLWNKEWKTVLLSFQMTAPYLQVGGVVIMTLLSWPLASHVFCLRKKGKYASHSEYLKSRGYNPFAMLDIRMRVVIIGLYGAVLLSLYLVPLGMYSPCIKEISSLGPAPALIGHRGAPMLAPENTYMSFEKVVAAGGDGLETDVTISYDGIPFLMHDKSLHRTTNVKDVFPNRTSSPASMFTWKELQQLNAGAWFFSQNPFKTASSLSPKDRLQAQNQSVCTLRAVLELAAQNGKLVIFDLYRPPSGHPYRDIWISRTLEVIQSESSIPSNQVLWLPPEQREFVQERDPELQQTSGSPASVEELQQNHIVRLNLHYSAMSEAEISKYSAVNISTNLYVVSEPWLFSLAWCAGVHSVTTNAVHILKSLRRPLFFMTPQEYNTMWILTDMVSLIVIVAVFIFHCGREGRERSMGQWERGEKEEYGLVGERSMGWWERGVWVGGRGEYGSVGERSMGRWERGVWVGGRGEYGSVGERSMGRWERGVWVGGREEYGSVGERSMGRWERGVWVGGREEYGLVGVRSMGQWERGVWVGEREEYGSVGERSMGWWKRGVWVSGREEYGSVDERSMGQWERGVWVSAREEYGSVGESREEYGSVEERSMGLWKRGVWVSGREEYGSVRERSMGQCESAERSMGQWKRGVSVCGREEYGSVEERSMGQWKRGVWVSAREEYGSVEERSMGQWERGVWVSGREEYGSVGERSMGRWKRGVWVGGREEYGSAGERSMGQWERGVWVSGREEYGSVEERSMGQWKRGVWVGGREEYGLVGERSMGR